MTRILAAARDAALALALVGGPPAGLLAVAGSPLPRRLPTDAELRAWVHDPLQPAFAAGTATTAGWLLWMLITAIILTCLLRHLPARLRRAAAQLPPPVQSLTATMLGAAAVTSAAAPATAAPPATEAGTAATHDAAVDPAGVASRQLVAVAARQAGHADTTAAVAGHPTWRGDAAARTADPTRRTAVCVVRRGDTLFGLADAHLGDGDRWPEIYALNRGTRFPDVGGVLTNPDLIHPGWRLRLPDLQEQPGTPHPATTPPGTPSAPPATTTPEPSATAEPDDGVTHPPTGSSPTPPTDGGPGSVAASPRGSERTDSPVTRGVSLPGGSWIDLSLASAIVAAVALVWAHRRHRYTRRPPSARPRLKHPDITPMPAVVNQIRRRLRQSALGDDMVAVTVPTGQDDQAAQDERRSHIAANTLSDDDHDATADQGERPDGTHDTDSGQPAGHDGEPTGPPAPAHPLLDGWPSAGLGVTGPGAEAAARGLLIAGLAAGGVDEPAARTQVIIPAATAATLLPAAVLPHTPRLTVTDGLEQAIQVLEAQTLQRSRLLHRHDVDDLAALRSADPYAEPLPPIMLLTDTPGRHDRTRIAALLSQGQRLDIHGVLLGAWLDGTTITVAADGTTAPADHDTTHPGSLPADIGRFTVLHPDETIDLITTLAESHTGQPPTDAPTDAPDQPAAPPVAAPPETSPTAADSPAPAASPAVTKLAIGAPHDAQEPSNEALAAAPPTAQPTDHVTEPADRPDSADTRDPAVAAAAASGTHAKRVEVTVLGRPTIVDADPQRAPRAKSMELLVYLTVHDGVALVENILDDLLPDAPASKAVHRLHTYVSDLRAVLRHNAGPGSYLTHPNQRYVLNTDTIGSDLWRMRDALRDAETADSDQERIAALRRAVDTYRRPLADGCDYEWIEPYREGIRQQALDAALALADLLADQPADQLTVLEAAIAHSPYAEPLYQAAMRAHAALGHLDAIRAVRRSLIRRLAEIDAEPGNDTLALADELVTGLQRAPTRTRPRRAPGPGDGAAA